MHSRGRSTTRRARGSDVSALDSGDGSSVKGSEGGSSGPEDNDSGEPKKKKANKSNHRRMCKKARASSSGKKLVAAAKVAGKRMCGMCMKGDKDRAHSLGSSSGPSG